MLATDYPRETREAVPFTVKVNGVEVFTGVEISVVTSGSRPGDTWVAPILLDGKLCTVISGMALGVYWVWGHVIGTEPELPVFFIGSFRVA